MNKLKLRLFHFSERLHLRAKREAEGAIERLSPDREWILRNESLQAEILWLRQTLRRAPRWAMGHLVLGKAALAARQLRLAFGSACAVLKLTERSTRSLDLRLRAEFLLAQVYLRSGEDLKAEALLRRLASERLPGNLRILVEEELAAALLVTNSPAEARKVLEALPSDALSPGGFAARDYVRRKH